MRIQHLSISPLSVPLIEPFVIATGRIDTTRAALVQATLVDAHGRRAVGLGEAAALPPVTAEDQPELLAQLRIASARMTDVELGRLDTPDEVQGLLDECFEGQPVARAGMECALLDAAAQLASQPLCTWLTGAPPRDVITDMTLPIADPAHMAALARGYSAQGFNIFKVKIGKAIDDDLRALALIAHAVPSARFRLDANAGFSADQALRVLDACHAHELQLECFEQPCGRDDLSGMARVTASTRVPVVADESVRTLTELERVIDARAASGVNLKLVKCGGPLAALRIGQRAREAGLAIMCGGMVETRLGMTAMGHVVCALGGVDFADLDTAFLLASDPFEGGYTSEGALLRFLDTPGHGVSLRPPGLGTPVPPCASNPGTHLA
ncbi:MAG: dipeptide epimerase [Sandaracinaceae bacterium]|jgi:L-alanine-DL-glutamate epimerase-like enolase superfamily enzyme|nr:dipeptide epimerase [Sandaracinaceae bacterium]MBK7154072.1 dipeptide epimerase [Sandaracinaceae bacterium]MBK7776543.1 dipeptide epimerase [Sandaracinaceae bacterium]MBP7682180.1 dipeptide epimerase [Deltaproteobacteria bacterium]